MHTISLAAGICLFAGLALVADGQEPGRKPKLILDADTANELDDCYAVIRVLRQDKFEVLGLNSTQWHRYGFMETVQASQKVNEKLIRFLGREDLPVPMGSDAPMGRHGSGDEPKDSPAAQFIIKSAFAMPEGEKLNVACIGALSNLGSALKLKPEIAPRIRAYFLGFKYDRQTGVWNKNDYNVRRDLSAADVVLNLKDLELHIMPSTVSIAFTFERDDTFERQAKMGELGQYLTQRWKSLSPLSATKTRWIMWDVAAVQAIINPDMAAEEQVMTPPENTQRKVWMFHTIAVDRMRADFWKAAMSSSATDNSPASNRTKE